MDVLKDANIGHIGQEEALLMQHGVCVSHGDTGTPKRSCKLDKFTHGRCLLLGSPIIVTLSVTERTLSDLRRA